MKVSSGAATRSKSLPVLTIHLIFYPMKKNARGVGNRPTVRRLKYLVNIHKPYMLVVLEPMIDVSQSEDIMREMGFDKFYANNEGVAKIWVFGRASN